MSIVSYILACRRLAHKTADVYCKSVRKQREVCVKDTPKKHVECTFKPQKASSDMSVA